jgi:hypothetical protein
MHCPHICFLYTLPYNLTKWVYAFASFTPVCDSFSISIKSVSFFLRISAWDGKLTLSTNSVNSVLLVIFAPEGFHTHLSYYDFKLFFLSINSKIRHLHGQKKADGWGPKRTFAIAISQFVNFMASKHLFLAVVIGSSFLPSL